MELRTAVGFGITLIINMNNMKQLDIALLALALIILGVGIYVSIEPEENNVPCAEGWERTKTTCIKID